MCVALPSCLDLAGTPGIAGAVQQLQLHPTLPLLASVGLDRFLRIHDLQTRSLVRKVYLKTRSNAIVVDHTPLAAPAPSAPAEPRKRAARTTQPAADEGSGPDVWDELDRAAPADPKKRAGVRKRV